MDKINILAMSQDPIYIGTGGFTIGRVDNTIVRDPITRIPKIPGTSLAGTWRYYMALTLYSYFNDKYKINRFARMKNGKEVTKEELFRAGAGEWVTEVKGNKYAAIKCAGQDEEPNSTLEQSKTSESGHCGHCIVCKAFGYSKNGNSERGMAYFSDLNILLFPVYTRFGTMWITSKDVLISAGVKREIVESIKLSEDKVVIFDENIKNKNINIGWLNFKADKEDIDICSEICKNIKNDGDSNVQVPVLQDFITNEKIIIVPDSIISQIINSNLETRTSVSINPITGAAKDKALFTSEAIPRGTVFYGNFRIEERPLSDEPKQEYVEAALSESKKFFETLGIGGMTTRGFGRMKIFDWRGKDGSED